MMSLMFLLLGFAPGATTVVVPFVLLYGVSYFFTEFGPNHDDVHLPGRALSHRCAQYRSRNFGRGRQVGRCAAAASCPVVLVKLPNEDVRQRAQPVEAEEA